MTNLSKKINTEFNREIKYRLYKEFMPRIKLCLDKLDEDQIWWRPNAHCNSIGNLVLHLAGNVRQWIGSGIAGQEDVRKRSKEFEEREPIPKNQLWEHLSGTMLEIESILDSVKAEDLITFRPVQVFEESVLTILVHVIEHFSYHTGQIAWITKMLTDEDLGFYKGVDLG